ncbi:MAG: homoserine kinase [Clostridiales bacterium]|nr:homoserine kinase [Clostridiales bacterium]
MRPASVRVPASAANLGPGYDSFGLALGLYNTFRATPSAQWSVSVEGEGRGTLDQGAANQVALAMARVFAEVSGAPIAARIECENGIPAGRGLGSSAAAIVGGLLLGDTMCGGLLGRERLLELAVDMEGHPDNVAAALLGGFTIGWRGPDGPAARALPIGCGLAAVVAVAAAPLLTSASRGLLPEVVPHEDAAFNAGRAALLAAGLVLGRDELIAAGLADRLHEPYRAAAVPGLADVAQVLKHAGALGAVLSGAGPTVIGIVTADDDASAFARAKDVARRASKRVIAIGGYIAPMALPVDRSGTAVLEG